MQQMFSIPEECRPQKCTLNTETSLPPRGIQEMSLWHLKRAFEGQWRAVVRPIPEYLTPCSEKDVFPLRLEFGDAIDNP